MRELPYAPPSPGDGEASLTRLHVVDEHGEIQGDCASCAELRLQLEGAEREIRAWRTRTINAERDSARDAFNHPSWEDVKELFAYWRMRTDHPRCRYGAKRFWAAEPFLRDYGEKLCRRAIDGIAFDPFTKRRRNGTLERFDSWELLFRDRGRFEGFVNRAPLA